MSESAASGPPTAATPNASRRRAFEDVALQLGTRVANLALGVFVTAVLVRSLGDVGFGQWVTLVTTFQLLAFFTSLGLEAVTVREAASHPEEAEAWIAALLVTRLALSVPVVAAAFGLLLYIQDSDAMLVAGLILLIEFPLGVGSSLQVVHQLRVRNGVPMMVLTVNSVGWGLCVLTIGYFDGGLVPLAISLTAVTFLTSLIQAVAAVRIVGFRLRPTRRIIVRLLRIGTPLGISGVLVTAYARIDQLIVFKETGAAAAGLYGAVYRVIEQAHFVPISVMTTLAPVLAVAWHRDRERAVRIATLAAELMTMATLGGLAVSLVAAEPLVRLVFGEEFVPAAEALPVLSGAFVFICFGYLTGNLLLVLGLVKRQLIVAAVGLVVNVIGNLLLVPVYGYMAAAWMTLATEVAVVGTAGYFVRQGLGPGVLTFGRIGRIIVAAGLLTVVLLGVRSIGGPLLVLAFAALVGYPVLLLRLGAVQVAELRGLLGRSAPTVA